MREIKFRAFIFEENRMIDVVGLDLGKPHQYVQWYDDPSDRNAVNDCLFEKAELMQYTGLKDKNGTEIYEGDIINGGSLQCNGNFTIANGTQEVVFESGMFKSGGVSLCSFNHIEIIGNIYEKESETK